MRDSSVSKAGEYGSGRGVNFVLSGGTNERIAQGDLSTILFVLLEGTLCTPLEGYTLYSQGVQLVILESTGVCTPRGYNLFSCTTGVKGKRRTQDIGYNHPYA